MTTGLEFVRSWRFWVLFLGSTSLVMLASTGAQIALVSYLQTPDTEPDPFFPLLGEVAVLFLSVAIWWFADVRKKGEPRYPEEHGQLLFLIIAVASMLVPIAEWSVVHFLIVNWIAPDASAGGPSFIFVFVFAFSAGLYIAMVEWEAITGANNHPQRATTPESP